MVEFVIAAPVLLLLGLSMMQISLIYHAKTTLNYATYEAARAGSVEHAQIQPMKRAFSMRMAPVQGGDGTEQGAMKAILKAGIDSVDPRFTRIEILNPTTAAFAAWGVHDRTTGQLQIPNHHMRHQNASVIKADVNIHDANILKIKATYGYPLEVPFVGKLLARTMLFFNPAQATYLGFQRIPLISYATVRMQNEAWPTESEVVAAAPVTTTSANGQTDNDSNSGNSSTLAGVSCDANGLGETTSPVDGGLPTISGDPAPTTLSSCQGTSSGVGQYLSEIQSQFTTCTSG